MVCHKHIQGIESIGIIGTGADCDALLTRIIVPTRRAPVDSIGVSHQIIEAVDAIGFHHLVAFRKDRISNLTLRGRV